MNDLVTWWKAFLRSFVYASNGLRLVSRERNARVQALAMIGAVALGIYLRISRIEWALLIVTIALVLVLETLNTAIEALVNLVSPARHPLAEAAKDLAAGAVWLAALVSVIMGLLIFLPRLL